MLTPSHLAWFVIMLHELQSWQVNVLRNVKMRRLDQVHPLLKLLECNVVPSETSLTMSTVCKIVTCYIHRISYGSVCLKCIEIVFKCLYIYLGYAFSCYIDVSIIFVCDLIGALTELHALTFEVVRGTNSIQQKSVTDLPMELHFIW